MENNKLPRQFIIVSITSAILIVAGILLINIKGWFEGSVYYGWHAVSIAVFILLRSSILNRSIRDAMTSIVLAKKFRIESVELLDDCDRDDLKMEIRKARSACDACRKCWSTPRALILVAGLGISGFTMALSIIWMVNPGIGGWEIAACVSGMAIAAIEMASIARESSRARTCAKAYTMSRRANDALESIVRNA